MPRRTYTPTASPSELLREAQFVVMRGVLDPEECRREGRNIMGYRSHLWEGSVPKTTARHDVRKVSVTARILRGDLPGVVALQDQIMDAVKQAGFVSPSWGTGRDGTSLSALGHIAKPGGGYWLHRDNEKVGIREANVVANLLCPRQVVVIPCRNALEEQVPPGPVPEPMLLEEGELLVMDPLANPWHSTYNNTSDTAVTMPMVERPRR